MAMRAQDGTISRQIDALQTAVEDTAREGGENAIAIAEKGRQILTMARDLASDIAQATRDEATSRAARVYRRVADTAQHDVEVARDAVRAHPLLTVAGVAAVSALVAVIVTSAVQRNHRQQW